MDLHASSDGEGWDGVSERPRMNLWFQEPAPSSPEQMTSGCTGAPAPTVIQEDDDDAVLLLTKLGTHSTEPLDSLGTQAAEHEGAPAECEAKAPEAGVA